MKRYLLIILCVFCGLSCAAQNTIRPEWTQGYFKDLPNSTIKVVSAYYYDLEGARNKAVSLTIADQTNATGSEVNVSISGNNVQVTGGHEAIVKMRIIDEYRDHTPDGWTVYLLVQTAKNPTYAYEPVKVSNHYAFSPRVFVPGMAQIYKGTAGKGVAFICGEALCVGGVIVSQSMKADFIAKMNATHNADQKRQYANNANACNVAGYVSVFGAAGIYLWNVIDGMVSTGKTKVMMDNKVISLAPYATPEATGLAMSIHF